MSAPQQRINDARQRMLEAADLRDTVGGGMGAWEAWQQAAADYWVLKHPEAARFRRGDPNRNLTIDEIRELEQQINRAMDAVPSWWRLTPVSKVKVERLAQVGWFHELYAALYEPVYAAAEKLRAGDADGTEMAIRFLEADPHCFRSGYAKADLIRFLTRVSLSEADTQRLRAVVLRTVRQTARREFRSYIRLARHVDSERLRNELGALAESDDATARRQARWILIGLGGAEREIRASKSRLPPGWFWYDDAAFDLTFACPRKGVSGGAVTVDKELRPDGAVVHVSTDDFSEVYFELRQASSQTAEQAFAGLKQRVAERFPDARFGDAEPAELAGKRATGMTFEFEDRVRRALCTTGSSPLYVVVVDPRSLLNELIVASLAPRWGTATKPPNTSANST